MLYSKRINNRTFNLREIIGLIIWWTEGTKSYRDKRWKNSWLYHVDVTNTNPDIIRLFLAFLRKDIGIDESRLKLQLQIHEGDNQKLLESYWSNVTHIPKLRFTKTIIRPKGNKIGKSKGTCKVRYCDKNTYNRLSYLLKTLLKKSIRGVAQMASASGLGPEGPGFKSQHPDQVNKVNLKPCG